MKTWGLVCALLSGAIFAALLASMTSCSRTYEVDAKGGLLRVDSDESTNPPTVRRDAVSWSSAPLVQPLEPWVQPGDRLVSTETNGGIWFDLKMAKVEVFRGEESVMLVRSGHILFWAITLAVSLFPIICFGIGTLWIANLSPRRLGVHGEDSS